MDVDINDSARSGALAQRRIRRRDMVSLIGLGMVANRMNAASERLERLEEWLHADGKARKKALELCLARIQQMDPSIHAWVQVLPQPQTGDGPLSGIPFGVKDIIETKNLVTEYGSPIYKGRHGSADAAIVRRIQGLGGIMVGKTEAAAFAYRTPPSTRNPRDLGHTPGGSSSGSAAAVAAGMVPIALGTQTMGSVLRPASYCGVTGFKPTFGVLPMEGVLPLSHTLDTLGLFTNTPADMLLLWEALGQPVGRTEDVAFGVVEPLKDLEPSMAATFRETIALLRKRGLAIEPVPIAPMIDKLVEETRIVMTYEGARFHEQRFKEYGSRLLDLADLVRAGLEISDQRYREALTLISQGKEQLAERYKTTPVILAPAATGPAPSGLASTGDSRMNAPWTALGTPAISIPMPVTSGLPLGIQLTAERMQDARVLRASVRLAQLFDSHP
jgi:Asp-tRNA(Asn)/Glu-tRNA(Gln) amidotransferase A subunit family amidase